MYRTIRMSFNAWKAAHKAGETMDSFAAKLFAAKYGESLPPDAVQLNKDRIFPAYLDHTWVAVFEHPSFGTGPTFTVDEAIGMPAGVELDIAVCELLWRCPYSSEYGHSTNPENVGVILDMLLGDCCEADVSVRSKQGEWQWTIHTPVPLFGVESDLTLAVCTAALKALRSGALKLHPLMPEQKKAS